MLVALTFVSVFPIVYKTTLKCNGREGVYTHVILATVYADAGFYEFGNTH